MERPPLRSAEPDHVRKLQPADGRPLRYLNSPRRDGILKMPLALQLPVCRSRNLLVGLEMSIGSAKLISCRGLGPSSAAQRTETLREAKLQGTCEPGEPQSHGKMRSERNRMLAVEIMPFEL